MKQLVNGFCGVMLMSALVVLPGCESEVPMGCTDSRAVNYNVEAFEDSGDCIYPADLFVGNLAGSDTAIVFNQGVPHLETSKMTFQIAKEEYDIVTISGFANCNNLLEAKVLYQKYLYIISGYEHDFVGSFTFELRDDILFYQYWSLPNANYPDPAEHKGRAVWR